jgi:hypothetical protein
MERQSVGAMAGGIVGITGGGILLIAGAFAAIPSCSDNFNGTTSTFMCDGHEATVIGLVVAGLVSIAVGIPLLVYGAKKVPVGAPETSQLQKRLPVWAGTPAPRGWEWRF